MNKKPITWIELLKKKMVLKGKGSSIKDVATDAKKEWEQIKEGKHALYIKGEFNKTKKNKRTRTKKTRTKQTRTKRTATKSKKNKVASKKKSLRKKQKGGDSCGSCVSCDNNNNPLKGGSCESCGSL